MEKRKIKQDNLIENLRHEILIMRRVKHPNVVRLYEVLSSHSKIYLVMELIECGELFEKLKLEGALCEEEARRIFQQIVAAVAFCGEHNIAHRDLKLENVLLDAYGRVKISDFGLSSLFSSEAHTAELMHTTCGTVNYAAPEIFSNQGYDGHLADIWSCGVILFALLMGRLPFEDEKVSKLIEKIVCAQYEEPEYASREARDLLHRLLNPDPRTRITIGQLKEDPWFAVDYIEPEGLYEEETTGIRSTHSSGEIVVGEDKPKAMTAFELVNFASGTLMNRMFCPSEQETYFASSASPSVLFRRLTAGLVGSGFRLKTPSVGQKLEFSSPLTGLAVEIFQLLPSLHLVTVTRSSGSLQDFEAAFGRLLAQVTDLVLTS